LPEELKKKLQEGSELTSEEVKQVAEYHKFLESDTLEAREARDRAKRKARELEEAEEARRAEEEKRKNNELTEVERLRKEKDEAEAKLAAEKAEADAYRAFRQERIEKAKEALGDKWREGYASLSLADLDATVASLTATPKGGTPPPPGGGSSESPKDYKDYIANMSKYLEWGRKNPETVERMRREYQVSKRS